MNLNATIPETREYVGNFRTGTTEIVHFIQADTTPAEFDTKRGEFPLYRLYYGGKCNWTALAVAASKGNIPLIEHIFAIGGKSLLFMANFSHETPLHCACACEDQEKGYLAAKKLIQLGTPVNIAEKLEIDGGNGFYFQKPLDTALANGNIKIATMLLRLGGIAKLVDPSPKMLATLEEARKQIMTDNEKLFKIGTALELPNDVSYCILSISAQLL